jgi:hypothetical protein
VLLYGIDPWALSLSIMERLATESLQIKVRGQVLELQSEQNRINFPVQDKGFVLPGP